MLMLWCHHPMKVLRLYLWVPEPVKGFLVLAASLILWKHVRYVFAFLLLFLFMILLRIQCNHPLENNSFWFFKVCTKATEPGNKNRRLNTSILVRYIRPSGTCNILIDCGKWVQWVVWMWFYLALFFFWYDWSCSILQSCWLLYADFLTPLSWQVLLP